MDDLKELLGHIDQPTRAEIIRRCAHYEREIKHLQEQYRQLQEACPQPESATTQKIISRARQDVYSALRRSDTCSVFYSDVEKRFRVVTQEVRTAKEATRAALIGTYTKDLDKTALTEDLYAALEGA